MKRKLETEVYVSFFLILELIICIIMKVTNIIQIEWWHFLYTNLFTVFIYMFILEIKYNGKEDDKLMLPMATMTISLTVLGIVAIMIPHFREIPLFLKMWTILLVTLIIILIYVYIKQYVTNNLEIKKIEESYRNDIEKHEYYREILEDYSPAILSLIYNRKIKYSDTLVATILDLKLNNYIDIEEKGIKVLKKDEKDLLPNQKMIYKMLQKKKNRQGFVSFKDTSPAFSNSYFKREWKETIKKEAEEKDLCSSKFVVFNIIEKISIFSFWAIIVMTATVMIGNLESIFDEEIGIVSYIIIIAINCFLMFTKAFLSKFNQRNFFVRTKKGVELQCKMAGLKNYIKDYSQLEKKKLEEIVLWEDYLIYALIFDLKGSLDKEAKELYKNLAIE